MLRKMTQANGNMYFLNAKIDSDGCPSRTLANELVTGRQSFPWAAGDSQ